MQTLTLIFHLSSRLSMSHIPELLKSSVGRASFFKIQRALVLFFKCKKKKLHTQKRGKKGSGGSSPTLGFPLSGESASPAASAHPPLAFSLSQTN